MYYVLQQLDVSIFFKSKSRQKLLLPLAFLLYLHYTGYDSNKKYIMLK